MTIRDRGKMKWFGAFFMPEHVKLLKGLGSDYYKVPKPMLDEYQIDELEQKISLAIEFTYPVKITIWEDGFFKDFIGFIKRLDGIYKKIHLDQKDGYTIRLNFKDIVEVDVNEDN